MASRAAAGPGRLPRNALSSPVLSFDNIGTRSLPGSRSPSLEEPLLTPCFFCFLKDGGQLQPGQQPPQGTGVQGEKAPVKLGNVPHDGQPEPAAGNAFVQPFPPRAHLAALLGR